MASSTYAGRAAERRFAEAELARARAAHRDDAPRDTRERLRVALRQRVLK